MMSLLVSRLFFPWYGTGTCLLPVTRAGCCMAAVLWLVSGRVFCSWSFAGLSSCSWTGAVLGHWGVEKLGDGRELSPARSSAVQSITRCLGVVVPSAGDIFCCCHCHPLVPAWWRALLRSSQAPVAQHSPQVLSWEFGYPLSYYSDLLKGL